MTPPQRAGRRREPRQERSRAMVERIVAAGRAVLLERGYDGASTNRIAAAAGISPGSLYQYFPDKDAVLAEVVDRYTEALEARIAHAFVGTLGSSDVRAAVRTTLTTLLDVFEEEPALLRVVVEELPRSPEGRRARFARRIDEVATTALRSRPGRDARPAGAVAWMLVRAVEHVTTSYVLERPPIGRDVLLDELTELVADHLE